MDYIRYANQNATRNQPLSSDLVSALGFLPELGVQAEVFSGGQPVKGSGQPRVGSVRHDAGGAADVFFYKDGRRLDWANPEDQPIFSEIVSRGRERGLTGFGAGPDYMQPGSMHIGFGAPAVWGAGGKGENAPDWLTQAYSGAEAPQGGNMQRQPQGLLGTPAVSTRGQAPQQAPAQEEERKPFFQRPGVANAFDTLAMGLQGMTINPNQGLIQSAQQRIQQRREMGQMEQQRNRTVKALEQLGADPQLIQLAESGYADAALKEAIRMRRGGEPRKGVTMGDRLVDPVTGEVIADFSGQRPQYDPEDISKARKEFTSLPAVKEFAEQTSAYSRVISSVDDPSAAGDLSLIFNYMKVLDPGSTVREGEFATAQNAGGVDQRVAGLYNRIMSGERLTPEQRADFADRATRLYQGAEEQYQSVAGQYGEFARSAGLPVEQVIPDFGYSGELYQTPLALRRPPPPSGVDKGQWAQAWSNMTDEERKAFLEDNQ